MHVDREKLSAKFWLDPDVRISENLGYGRQELREIECIARQHIVLLRSEWDEFCLSGTHACRTQHPRNVAILRLQELAMEFTGWIWTKTLAWTDCYWARNR